MPDRKPLGQKYLAKEYPEIRNSGISATQKVVFFNEIA